MSGMEKIFSRSDLIRPRTSFVKEGWGSMQLWRFTAAAPGTRVYFTTRKGGVSRIPYDSLNLGFHVGDLPDRVRENRAVLAGLLGLDPIKITSPCQRHTTEVNCLEDDALVGQGALEERSFFDPCDGLVTALPGAPILLHFADCVPVVLTGVVAGRPAIGVIHAGRRGLFDGVIRNGVNAMSDQLGVEPAELVAAIGPAIAPCCYEVDAAPARDFSGRYGGEVVLEKEGKYLLDLGTAATKELESAGLSPVNIHLLGICTCCEEGFFSYRRDGTTGRHGAIAWIE